MIKNDAPQFFFYNDEYYEQLGNLGTKIKIVWNISKQRVSRWSYCNNYKNYALYHLGALKKGLNNLEVLTLSLRIMENSL